MRLLKRSKALSAIGLAALALGAPSPGFAGEGVTRLANAELHVGDGSVIKNATIEIQGEEIVGVWEAGKAPSKSAEAEEIDLKGAMVTPGFVATLSGLGLVEIGLESSTRDDSRQDENPIRAGFDPALAYNSRAASIGVTVREGFTSSTITPNGGMLSGQVNWVDLMPGLLEGNVTEAQIGIRGGLGQIAGSRAEAWDLLRRVLEDAKLYQQKKSAYEKRGLRELAAHPRDLAALAPILDGKRPLAMQIHRASDILALLSLAEEFKLKVIVVGGAEAWMVGEQLAKAKVPVVLQPSQNLPGGFDRLGARLDNAALLEKAGVEIVIAEIGNAHNARNARQEAGIAVAYGLSPATALEALTSNPAEIFGVDARYGTVAKGKVANLVVWPEDPFELSSFPTQVWVRGEIVPDDSRHKQLRDRYLDLSKFKP